MSRRSFPSEAWRPLFSRISLTGTAILPLFGTASRTRSEGLELTGNYLLRDAGDVLKGGVHDGLDLPGDGLEARPVLRDDLGTRNEGLVDGVPDLGEDADVDLLDPLHLLHALPGDLGGEEVVDLPDVVDGVFARGRLHGHGPVRGDEAVAAVAPPDGTVVP